LQFTFLTLAILVIGGINSLAGVVVGTFFITVISHILDRWTNGDSIVGITMDIPPGSREIAVALIMVAVLVFRPQGITGGREIKWPFRSRSTEDPEPSNNVTSDNTGAN
jgi:branched-chain amino acid transport system permease protein